MGDEIPEDVRGRRLSVEVYEVAFEAEMWSAPPARLRYDRRRRTKNEALPAAAALTCTRPERVAIQVINRPLRRAATATRPTRTLARAAVNPRWTRITLPLRTRSVGMSPR